MVIVLFPLRVIKLTKIMNGTGIATYSLGLYVLQLNKVEHEFGKCMQIIYHETIDIVEILTHIYAKELIHKLEYLLDISE